jgi:ribosomal protein S18 acetylase RimI-like enzyme
MIATSDSRVVTAMRTLDIQDIRRMRGRWEPRLDTRQIERIVAETPGRSIWIPQTGEVVVVGTWRHRAEISSVAGVHAIRDLRDLMRATVDQSRRLGADAFVAIEWDERQHPEFYQSVGLELMDVVIPFEAPVRNAAIPARTGVSPEQVDIVTSIRELLDIDNAAFPWLWINNGAEFLDYAETPGVEVWGHRLGGRLVSYVGFTYFGNWGHVDRIAVHPQAQRQGLARQLMVLAMQRMARSGSRTIGLSTQAGNWKSQRLYEQLGFRQSSHNAYRVYGRVFRPSIVDEYGGPGRAAN